MSAIVQTRRGLFGLIAGAFASPAFARLPAPEIVVRSTFTAYPSASHCLTLQDIVVATLRNRSGVIVDNLGRNNALLTRLENTGAECRG